MRWARSSPTCPRRSRAGLTRGPVSRWCGGRFTPAVQRTSFRRRAPSAGPCGCLMRSCGRTSGRCSRSLSHAVVRPYAVSATIEHRRGAPPVVNDPVLVGRLRAAADLMLGPQAPTPTVQSLGGEDFAWYLQAVPGAMARLGTRTPGGATYDLHQGDLVVDERAVAIGARLLLGVAMTHRPD